MGREEQGRTWRMDAAQLDTQRKKEEVILKTSSTTYSTIRSSSSTRPAKLQLDRAEKSTVKPEKCYMTTTPGLYVIGDFHMEVMEIAWKRSTKSSNNSCSRNGVHRVGWISLSNDPMPPRLDSHWLTPCF
ncbi:unnamed protein product [Microthlaspi erraticum]|uniref:Uncharacterized protein n=1 Tax=Microthlaspi erraticum TaxID=1685480 RepID=A0A6D2HP47_9BRAS|nr:unnamed protein product [Microthlaspi erraticum]